mmetsp:Transcript_69405/g.192101  ORF Transcript_69405/g.192101 Transcript_69405/m.192101 type:complete len:285 (-) Transcript_69405:41-895(-)
MFTAVSELSLLSDAQATRFPYSTYSLSMSLALRVGGWDPEWIAEDWHMGIKCFLLTFGKCHVQPILYPTINYMPEDCTWGGTVSARWTQAKRHALGISDTAYLLSMLPLVVAHVMQRGGAEGMNRLQTMSRLLCGSLAYMCRLVNAHEMVGIMPLFMLVGTLLKLIMHHTLSPFRSLDELFRWTASACSVLFFAATISTALTVAVFQVATETVQKRMDPEKAEPFVFRNRGLHFFYLLSSCMIFGMFHVLGMGIAMSSAAIKLVTSTTFDYEVAAKPTKEARLS